MRRDTYEVWFQKTDRSWHRAVDSRNETEFADKKEAERMTKAAALRVGVLEAVLIRREPIMRLNGPGGEEGDETT